MPFQQIVEMCVNLDVFVGELFHITLISKNYMENVSFEIEKSKVCFIVFFFF